eukprot:Pgem_evm1s12724
MTEPKMGLGDLHQEVEDHYSLSRPVTKLEFGKDNVKHLYVIDGLNTQYHVTHYLSNSNACENTPNKSIRENDAISNEDSIDQATSSNTKQNSYVTSVKKIIPKALSKKLHQVQPKPTHFHDKNSTDIDIPMSDLTSSGTSYLNHNDDMRLKNERYTSAASQLGE